jgi:FKBP-type peptidyl-prolyl cis-trans isomerase FkpA
MKSIFKIILLLTVATTFLACPEDDAPQAPPARPFEEVYLEDIEEIETFLETHYVVVDADYNTEFFEIPEGGTQTPISEMPELKFKLVNTHNIEYKVYYLELRLGTGESPTRIDSSFVSYKGNLLEDVSVTFDQSINPVWFPLEDVIRGWGEIIPEFKTGTHTANPDGTITFDNYGAGVMFLPSGLGYFNTATGNIPSYSSLIFNFKLYNLEFRDHDRDRILSKYEYGLNFNEEANDTDSDGIPDFIDVDDDGDGTLTKNEIKFTYMDGGVEKTGYYPFTGAAVDDPSTPYDDTKGIPNCSGDFTSIIRLRKHLDKNCE